MIPTTPNTHAQNVQTQKTTPQLQAKANRNVNDTLSSIKVRATDGGVYFDSEWSDTLNYVVTQVLDVPTNVKITGDALVWDEVPNAKGYVVKINDQEYEIEGNTNNLGLIDPGKYQVSVKAKGDGVVYQDSAYSQELTYTKTAQLPAPTNLAITGGQLSWDEVPNASAYEVEIDDEVQNVATNTLDVSTLPPGEYTIRVKALGDQTVRFSIKAPKFANSPNSTVKFVRPVTRA